MNAYELANELENKDRLWNVDENLMLNTCAMLRQQADRIAELEKLVSDMIYEKSSGVYDRPQIKELSDKEITQVFDECYPNNCDGDVVTLIDFARAILKKASEK